MSLSRRHVLLGALGTLAIAGCAATTPTPLPTPKPQETSPTMANTPTPPAEPDAPKSDKDQTDKDQAELDQAELDQAELDQALREAAWADDVKAARKLVKDGADVNAKDDTEQSAFLIATSEGHLELLRLCLTNGATIDDLDSWNGTGLIRAAERGHGLVVGELLQAGIDRDHVNRIGFQAIHEAVWLGRDTEEYHDTVRILAAGGVELDRRSVTEGLTPLEMARSKGFTGTARILEAVLSAKKPSDPDAALLKAAEAGDADRVATALRHGGDLDTSNGRRRTPLLLASAADRLEVARLLLALGAEVNALDDQSDTPVLVTGVSGSAEMLKLMTVHGPDYEIYNRFGGTALIPASERGHVEFVRYAVTTGINVNHVNDLGWTALLEAVILGDGGKRHQQVVEILLKNGADRNIADQNGVSALQHARNSGYRRITELLEG